MHAHSCWSYDGRWTLENIARLYSKLGVHAVMMSEHDTGFKPDRFGDYAEECARASTSRCVLVPGIEYSSPDNDIHVLAWGLDTFLGEHRPVLDTLHDIKARGGVAILAHPARRQAWKKVEQTWIEQLDGIEIWNRKTDGISWGEEAVKIACASGLPAYVGHDFHRARQLWPLYQQFRLASSTTAHNVGHALVTAIRRREGTPLAFGRAVVDENGAPRLHLPPTFEGVRRRISRLIK